MENQKLAIFSRKVFNNTVNPTLDFVNNYV